MAGKSLVRILRRCGWILFAPLAVAVAFALANLTLTVLFLAKEHQTGRLVVDARRLALSGRRPDVTEATRRFQALYASELGPKPEPEAIRRFLAASQWAGRPMILDQVIADYVGARWGRLDGRTLPPGVYVGARAIGPDTPPLSPLTKYLAQYALYARHGYVLVVEPPAARRPPTEFSASRVADFEPGAADPHSLMIRPEPFQPGAYDFPSRGQAIHELYLLSTDPGMIRATPTELAALAKPLRATESRYKVFGQNSNTVLGCMLRASELHRRTFENLRHDPLLSIRLLGIGWPLWSEPRDRPATVRCN